MFNELLRNTSLEQKRLPADKSEVRAWLDEAVNMRNITQSQDEYNELSFNQDLFMSYHQPVVRPAVSNQIEFFDFYATPRLVELFAPSNNVNGKAS